MPHPKATITEKWQKVHAAYESGTFVKFRDGAAFMNLQEHHFHKMFCQLFGATPKEVVTEGQIRRAKEMLLEGADLATIALQQGFSHADHFSKRFRQCTGFGPLEWKRRNQQTNA